MAILSVVESALPSNTFFIGSGVTFGVIWIAISASFTLLVTSLIVSRILFVRWQMREIMEASAVKMYMGVVAVLVESALPLAIIGVIFAVLLGKGVPGAIIVSGIWDAAVVSL